MPSPAKAYLYKNGIIPLLFLFSDLVNMDNLLYFIRSYSVHIPLLFCVIYKTEGGMKVEPIIQVEQLTKKYKRAKEPSVNGISFSVDPGEFFAFLGPNGAGKTTTISILTTTLSKTSGVVKIAGADLETDARKVRQQIGILFQNPSLDYELTAEENIRLHVSIYGIHPYRPLYRMMPNAYKERVAELAEMVGLKDQLFKKLKTFSGGMKRKLEIICSLMHNPKILFLDEPTQGLDAESRRSLWEYLQHIRQKENITIFLTTHYLEEAEGADRVCIINKGKIALAGTPEEIKNHLLVKKTMNLDAANRKQLIEELATNFCDYKEWEHGVKVYYDQKTPHSLLQQIKTPLTKLEIRVPSLEEAYVDLIKMQEGDKQYVGN